MPRVKVFDDLTSTLFDIIDAADKEGYSRFVKPRDYLPRDVSLRSNAALQRVLESALHPHYLFVSNAKSWPKSIEASRLKLDNGDWLVRFNAARLFFLPGNKPTKELTELRDLFEAMKPYFTANANNERPAIIRAMNQRDGNGRVYGSFSFLCCESGPKDFARELQARIDASPTLKHFQRHYALALSKIGRYSWCDLKEESFFPLLEQPWTSAFQERFIREKASASA